MLLRDRTTDLEECNKACDYLFRRALALETALLALYEWYDRDGSVGGASTVFEENREVLKK